MELTCAQEESLEMLLYQPARWRPSKASGTALCTICGLNLDAKGTQYIDAPAGTRMAILFPSRHWGRNLGRDEPMAASYIVVVTARANALDYKGSDSLYAWELLHLCHVVCIRVRRDPAAGLSLVHSGISTLS